MLVSVRKRVNNRHYLADIKCRLKVKLADESHKIFESMEELNGTLSNASEYFFLLISQKNLCLCEILFCQLLLKIYFLCEHHSCRNIYSLGVLNLYILFFSRQTFVICSYKWNILIRSILFSWIQWTITPCMFQENSCR